MSLDATDLRPVEALWLLAQENAQPWRREPVLRATLASLIQRGHLVPELDTGGFTTSEPDGDTELRGYEEAFVRTVSANKSPYKIVATVTSFSFGDFFEEHDYYTVKRTSNSTLYGLLSWPTLERNPTTQHETVANQLLKDTAFELSNAIDPPGDLDSTDAPMVYAYPDAEFYDRFTCCTEYIVNEPVNGIPAPRFVQIVHDYAKALKDATSIGKPTEVTFNDETETPEQ